MPNEDVIKILPAFADVRGVIANILDKPINHVAIITSKKGAIRANHFHPKQWQYEYLISGKYESHTKDLRQGDQAEIEKRIIVAGDLVITPPMVAHAMKFLEDSTMLNLTDGGRDAEEYAEHTKSFKLIE